MGSWNKFAEKRPEQGDAVWLYDSKPLYGMEAQLVPRVYFEGPGGTNPVHWTHWMLIEHPKPPED